MFKVTKKHFVSLSANLHTLGTEKLKQKSIFRKFLFLRAQFHIFIQIVLQRKEFFLVKMASIAYSKLPPPPTSQFSKLMERKKL